MTELESFPIHQILAVLVYLKEAGNYSVHGAYG